MGRMQLFLTYMFGIKFVSFSVIVVGTSVLIAHAFYRVGLDPISTMLSVVNAGCILQLVLWSERPVQRQQREDGVIDL